jgi:hypothetical protein
MSTVRFWTCKFGKHVRVNRLPAAVTCEFSSLNVQ